MRTIRSIAAFGLVAAAAAGLTVSGWRLVYSSAPVPPVLDCPAEVDLGPREFGSEAAGRFRIANHGGSVLHLTRFGTTCSCAGVEMEQDGVVRRLVDLRVPPGGSAEASTRVTVGASPGLSQTVLIVFQTNDPDRPEASIKVHIPRVTGGLDASPATVVFGDLPVGQPASKRVRLYAHGPATRGVAAVRSLHPDRFDARLVSPDGGADAGADPTARLVAVIEVVPRTDRPVRLDGAVEVVLAGESRATDKIAVLGSVAPEVLARPSKLVLPRYANGRPVYSGQVALNARDGSALAVAVESAPDGLTAAARPDPDNTGQWLLDVNVRPGDTAPRTVTVRLRADLTPGGPVGIDVPVTLSPPPAP
ncbi:MAG: hypothetical protein K2X82_30290 [Gemmataceae bacterium]|nr:hypothetical protein [Gemmataceae bacterium]